MYNIMPFKCVFLLNTAVLVGIRYGEETRVSYTSVWKTSGNDQKENPKREKQQERETKGGITNIKYSRRKR